MGNSKENISKEKKIILATTSIYRIEIFKKLWLYFVSEWSNVDEYTVDRPSDPVELTKYLAKLKAEVVAKNYKEGIVIWFDSVWLFNGEVLEKPKSREEWFSRLKTMSWQTFSFYGWVYMIDTSTGKILSNCIKTDSTMRGYSDEEINKYLDNCNEWYKTHAHGFNPCDYYSMTFINKMVGDPLNVMMWIPISTVMEMLKEIWYEI